MNGWGWSDSQKIIEAIQEYITRNHLTFNLPGADGNSEDFPSYVHVDGKDFFPINFAMNVAMYMDRSFRPDNADDDDVLRAAIGAACSLASMSVGVATEYMTASCMASLTRKSVEECRRRVRSFMCNYIADAARSGLYETQIPLSQLKGEFFAVKDELFDRGNGNNIPSFLEGLGYKVWEEGAYLHIGWSKEQK